MKLTLTLLQVAVVQVLVETDVVAAVKPLAIAWHQAFGKMAMDNELINDTSHVYHVHILRNNDIKKR
ncbi:hypothetical protein QVD17_38424 [Tagetes erecta]|uniref:Secreted protein n=1 Tax=Tagetes erecta TaxID=13708 RepID=A0AAD8NG79_TARER|nr:hypothetical protein QVD17_38424 [Tagetes erecta]